MRDIPGLLFPPASTWWKRTHTKVMNKVYTNNIIIIHEDSVGLSQIYLGGIPSSASSATSSLDNPVQKAESHRYKWPSLANMQTLVM